MTTAGFLLTIGGGWLGGVNYFRNLWGALSRLEGDPVQIVAVTGSGGLPDGMKGLERVRNCPTGQLDRMSPAWFARKTLAALGGRDSLMERLLSREGVDVLSHSPPLGRGARIRTIGWIPDLQHFRLPGFFTKKEKRWRDSHFRRICRESSLVILSSDAARRDLQEFYPQATEKVRVLHFVAGEEGGIGLDATAVLSKYGLPEAFLLLPNQYWAHKNHAVVIEALGLLKARGREILVVSTGDNGDYRNPGYFHKLMSRVKTLGVEENYRVLGSIPYGDLKTLMGCAEAILNPSLFEGWSTSVEEAKSLGKEVVLSDIPVHREQAPKRGRFFKPDDAEHLAELIWQNHMERDPAREIEEREMALADLPGRRSLFAREYLKIVGECLERS